MKDRQTENGNLKHEDFDDFIGCKDFVNNILQKNVSNDKELYNIFVSKFLGGESIFNNFFEKYGEIKEIILGDNLLSLYFRYL